MCAINECCDAHNIVQFHLFIFPRFTMHIASIDDVLTLWQNDMYFANFLFFIVLILFRLFR